MSFPTTGSMFSGARNCPFFTFTALPVRRGGDEQVGLAAEEGRDLQHVDDLAHRRGLLGALWKSVSTGTPTSRPTSARMARPSSRPGPRNESMLVRLALS